MPCFYDVLTCPRDNEASIRLVESAKRLGFCGIGLATRPDKGIEERARNLDIKVVFAAILDGAKRRDVARQYEALKHEGYRLFIVRPGSVDVARYASANKKYHGFIVSLGFERLVDRSTSRLFRERGWGIAVVSLDHLLRRGAGSRRAWRYYFISLRRGLAYGVPLALASCARDPSDLWHPASILGVAEVVGVPAEVAASWISRIPSAFFNGARLSSRNTPRTPS